jgi:hypothetical protein
MRQTVAGCLLWLLSCAAVLGQPPAAADDIEWLMAQLSSSKYVERVAAMKALEEKGAAALPALHQAAEKGDLELQRRAALLIERIEDQLAVAGLHAGRKVRLVFNDVLVLDAAAAWWAEARVRVEVDGDRVPLHNRKITLDTGDTTFWQAFTQFCDACGLTERPTSGSTLYVPRISLMVGKTPVHSTALAGPLRVRALPPGKAQAAFLLQVSPEPLMPWQGVTVVRLTKIVDQQGRLLAVADPFLKPPQVLSEDDRKGPGAIVGAEVVPVRLPDGAEAASPLKEVHGIVTGSVQVMRKLAVLKYASLTKGKTFPLNKYPHGLQILSVNRNGDHIALKLRVRGPLAETIALELLRPDIAGLPLTTVKCALLDARGQPWKLVAEDAVSGMEGAAVFAEVHVGFERQAKQDEPAQLVFSGTVSLPLEIPFVLRDVPL